MAEAQGKPVWYELTTPDPEDAQAFYAALVGWEVRPFAVPDAGGDYRVLHAPDGAGIGGITALREGGGARPGWTSYIGVGDVDATAARAAELGGSVLVPPMDIPGVGRFAGIADPQGIAVQVMRGDGAEAPQAFDLVAPGHCSWNELITRDHAAALRFYGVLFGWESTESISMGPMGEYCFIDCGGVRIGATMTAGPGFPLRWNHYFRVPSVGAASAAVAGAGGTVVMGPMPVPGGEHIVHGTDRQGLPFALVGGA